MTSNDPFATQPFDASAYSPTESLDHVSDSDWAEDAPDIAESSHADKRVPLVLLLDTSDSMSGEPIRQLNEGLSVLREALMEDSEARRRVEVSLITFGGSPQIRDLRTGYGNVSDSSEAFVQGGGFTPPQLSTSGATPMASALLKALDLIEERKDHYKARDYAYFRPLVMLITDGAPTDTESSWDQAVQRVQGAQQQKKVTLFPIGVERADMNRLNQLVWNDPSHPERNKPALKLQGIKFKELFLWLSASVDVMMASSDADTQVPLPSITGWAQLDL